MSCASILADEKAENTAKEFTRKIFSGDVKGAMELSGVPFSYDRKELLKDNDSLKAGLEGVASQNGRQEIEILALKEIDKSKGIHKDLKDEILIYDVTFKTKNGNVTLQVFIRKADKKAVGFFG